MHQMARSGVIRHLVEILGNGAQIFNRSCPSFRRNLVRVEAQALSLSLSLSLQPTQCYIQPSDQR